MNTALAAPKAKPPLRQDEYVTFRAGDVLITLQCVLVDRAYTVTTYRNSLRIEDQCTSIDNEADSRAIARTYARLAALEAS
jgi:hypothetical protein